MKTKAPQKKKPKTKAPPNPVGRPSKFTKTLGDKICAVLAEGISLRSACRDNREFPDAATVFRWIRENEDFRKQYARAKQESADAMGEEILDIADGGINVIKHTAEKKSSAAAQIVRLQVDTRKWLMSKHKPKKYGDTLDLTSDGKALPTPIYGGKSTKKL